jgi:hypothetical protein
MANMKDPNQGEGDRLAARRYDQHLESFVAQGKPAGAAEDARAWVDAHPNDAAHAERTARRGPHPLRSALTGVLAWFRSLV